MNTPTQEELTRRKCVPCEGGVPALTLGEAQDLVKNVEGWSLTEDGQRIRRDWTMRNFMAGIDFINRVATLAEEEGHHPDLFLEGYRQLSLELTTHAIGGLSENDFILAAKINTLPIQTKR